MSQGWETTLEDSLLPRIGGVRGGGERRHRWLLSSPKGFKLSEGTQHPSRPQLFASADCIGQSRWGLRPRNPENGHVLAGSRKDLHIQPEVVEDLDTALLPSSTGFPRV